ncbi:MAG TPA: LuxR C-terminal-related transcriptional regulator [Ktedonobacteraceae bacterium]
MPKAPLHTLIWSHEHHLYELYTQGQLEQCFRPAEEAAWQAWLREVVSFAFQGACGRLNVYQEVRPRGGSYWYAYHTSQGRTRKRYLGPTARVSLARLEEAAQALAREPTLPALADSLTQPPAEPELSLLSTKLAPPRLPNSLVVRDRLLADLERALSTPFTLLAASAGWGKTMLLSTWVSLHQERIAWLSLDFLDNDPFRFWAAVIAALRTCVPGVGTVALALLHEPVPPPFSAILTVLLNELALVTEHSAPIVVLLDDYHVIDHQVIDETLTFWVEHLPPHVRLLLSSRVDPDLPLARWRLRGQLAEIRATDLRFRPDEVSLFLRQAAGLSLSQDEVTALERRTEGWVAGLRLAALLLPRKEDRSAWIATFTGSHRYLLDYVQQDILSQQPDMLQDFLLQTAVLTRLSAPLCQAVTRAPEPQTCQQILQELERANLFLQPLDEQRQWYRLHDLFREALLALLEARDPQLLPQLHLRAARFYAEKGEIREAIAHALQAPDFSYAAGLMDRGAQSLWVSGEAQTVLTWIEALPDAVLWQHARLALEATLRLLESLHETTEMAYASAQAQVEHTLARLQEQLAHQEGRAGTSESEYVHHADELIVIGRRLRLLRALIETRVILRRRDKVRLAQVARELEGLAQDEEMSWNMIALSLSFWLTESFEREGALLIPRLLQFKQQAERAGDRLVSIRVIEWLANAYLRAGQMRQVERECLAGLALVKHIGGHTAWAGYLHLFLFHAYYAWNRLEEAAGSRQRTLRIAQDWQQVDLLTSGHLYMTWISLARGDLAAADQEMHLAEALVQQERFALSPISVEVARVQYWLAAGDLEAARTFAQQVLFSPETWDPNEKWAVLMLVRAYLALHQSPQALDILDRFRELLDRPGDIYMTIHMLALQVVALHQAGKREQALAATARLLALTERDGYIRVYLDQGEPMRQVLLAFLASHTRQHELTRSIAAYTSQLLVAFEQEEQGASTSEASATTPSPSSAFVPKTTPRQPSLVVSLTRREQEVLRLLAAGASNQDIAQTLVISLDTVKKHVSHLLGKLGATSRTQAIAQARARSLL